LPQGLHYQPFYCEENAWWLCADPALGPGERQVVFVVSLAGRVPLLGQRLAPPGRALAWDYHVVTVDGAGQVWDLDSRLALPSPGLDWLDSSFALAGRLPVVYGPRFRVLGASDFRRDFASDRRHMRDRRGRWLRPPPPWPAIGTGSNLGHYLDPLAPRPGRLMDLAGLRAWLAGPLAGGAGEGEGT
jgi:hypothetical protein